MALDLQICVSHWNIHKDQETSKEPLGESSVKGDRMWSYKGGKGTYGTGGIKWGEGGMAG